MDSPGQSANVFGNDNIIVQATGSGVNVSVGPKPFLRLTQYDRRTKLAARDNSDAALLSAYRADVVPLIGRDGTLSDLQAWLNTEASVSVRVLVGAGGRGKTRLALELARQVTNSEVTERGWLAGFATADELDRFRGQHGVEQWWDKPALIILDYAASRAEQLRAWIRELVNASFDGRPSLRLLLLERQASSIGWFDTVFGQGDNDASRAAISLLDPAEPVELPALDELEFRRQVFDALLKHGNGTLAAPAKSEDHEFDRLLGDRKWAGNPLYLMMAGLAAAKSGVREAFALSRADLALSIGRNELNRIGRIGAARGVDEKHQFPGAFVRHMAAIATLLQGLTRAEARHLASQEIKALGSAADLDATVAALTDALPADSSGGIAPILPDIVGEAVILDWFRPDGALAQVGIDGAQRILAVASISVSKASATLVRIARDFAEAGYTAPIQWLESLANAPETDLDALKEIADALPNDSTALATTAIALCARIAQTVRGAAEAERATGSGVKFQSILATTLQHLCVRFSKVGHNEASIKAGLESVDIFRRLAAERPEVFLRYLAMSLNNLSVSLDLGGCPEEALATWQEAIEIFRRLAAERPEVLPDLATSISALGGRLRQLGRPEEALAAGQESVDIYRRLTDERPGEFLKELAQSLQGLGLHFSALRLREEALSAMREAVDINRHLAAEQPDAFLPDFALSLNDLGGRLTELGRHEEALAAAREAVEIYRRLVEDRKLEAFRSDLAIALGSLGIYLHKFGHYEDALVAGQEVVDIRRCLAATQPDDLEGLALSLCLLSSWFGELGRNEEAAAAAYEAVEILAPIFFKRPGTFSQQMTIMTLQYLESCEALGVKPDLISLIVEAQQKLKESQDTPYPIADLERI